MKPTIGRVVYYHFMNAALAGEAVACVRPAMVTSVRENGRVNLHVMFEPDDLDAAASWEDDRNHRFDVAEIEATSGWFKSEPGLWSWPPRIG